MGAQAARLRAAGNERRPKLDYDLSFVGWNLTALPSCSPLELRLLLIFVLFSASLHDVLRYAHEESSGSKTNQMEESWRDFVHYRVARPQPRTPAARGNPPSLAFNLILSPSSMSSRCIYPPARCHRPSPSHRRVHNFATSSLLLCHYSPAILALLG
ncbi:hypothetical protein C8Q70DRAFT_170361 [Cubamyces menziesii]|nr:hypothetical protein C8Q70DRAFT_170361 [Cubamyces menziesii]